ncbi:hypothetical protein RC083_02150 [Pseudoalteromonas haloplanktis]|uniref:Orphan protein secreted protein n=1 Tax=Pseudoalteromonas haloplanktis TaxID=228 RepID=A0ABU1B9B3_PSEHA|nr:MULTISPECIES: hypothetical protein [Pseudoalteromonas]MDQ9090391.1 hypothetical protein [Pseudoalteromonas haloplanktis]TMN72518.1 hypothetical protein CWB85_06850 [Pseudoalteromonas sp. S1727]
MSYLKTILLTLCLTSSGFALANDSIEIAKELAVFKPYLGTWQADFKVEPGKPPIQDVSVWERALNGKAIRTSHSINEGVYGGESMIFWDSKEQSIVFYYFTTAGFYTKGTMNVLSPTKFVAYETVTGSKEGITKVRSTSEYKDDKFIVLTSYLKKGEWTKPEERIYIRSEKEVKFK